MECRSTCGLILFPASVGHDWAAARECYGDAPFQGIAAEPTTTAGRKHRVGGQGCALGQPGEHMATVLLVSGVMRCMRPLP
ncbi:hypothetical protein KIPE111705_40515 [Kibdelosporangium persicum]